MLRIYDCKTEYRTDPLGIGSLHPRFSWKLESDGTDILQRSYRISVRENGAEIWDSGLIPDQSQLVRYAGPALRSRQQLTWSVSVTAGEETAESAPARFETGLLGPSDWKAKWIQPEREADPDAYKPAPRLRKCFRVRPGLRSARIYQSAHGLYEFWLNGQAGTSEKFKPGFTSYYRRIQYQAYDVTALLHEGENCWAVLLGDGWWRGNTGGGNRNNFGFFLSFIGQIILTYEDGSTDFVVSDTDFKTAPGALLRCDMKAGEVYDARLEDGWRLAGFDDAGWEPVIPATEYTEAEALIASDSVPVKEQERFDGSAFTDTEGNRVLDFGQNHAGYVHMRLRNTVPGQAVTLTHGEGLWNGAFSVANIEETGPDPFQQVIYICRGGEEEVYTPTFAVFGYRFVKLEGYDGEILPGDFVSSAVYSDLEAAGTFTCSNPLINQLVSNALWSQKSNFLDVPTDCPTRERSPWSGDSQVYCKTAADFMNVYPFFEKWLTDLTLEQFEDGCVGNTFPSTNALHNPEERERMIRQGRFVFAPPTMAGPTGTGSFMDGSAGWGDTAVITPWTMYLSYGDPEILRRQYGSAKRWVDFCRRNAKNPNPLYQDQPQYHHMTFGVPDAEYIYDTHFHWGEWLEPDSPENGGSSAFDPAEFARTGNPLAATAYLYYSSTLLSKMAEVLKKPEDAADYAAYAALVKTIYNRYFIRDDGTILPGRQAPYVRTLAFGLAEDSKAPLAAARLAETVEACGYTLNTGFLSTPFLLRVLADYGYTEHAFRLLEQTGYPGWLHSVTLGATTICENWDSMDRFFGSFNHYSYGAVCDFLFGTVAGITPLEAAPGYRRFRIQPLIGGTLTHAEASMESPYGTIRSAWELISGRPVFTFRVPVNARAEIVLKESYLSPGAAAEYGAELQGGAWHFTLGSGTTVIGDAGR